MDSKGNKEKRKHERLPMELELLLSDGKFFVNSIIYNMSIGGIGIESSKKMEEGSMVNLVLDTKPPMKVSGIVRWCNKKGLIYQLGIQFTDLNQNQERELSRLLSSKAWALSHGE